MGHNLGLDNFIPSTLYSTLYCYLAWETWEKPDFYFGLENGMKTHQNVGKP